MVKYKINLIFKDTGESLNEIITKALKNELQKRTEMICNFSYKDVSSNYTHYSQSERSRN